MSAMMKLSIAFSLVRSVERALIVNGILRIKQRIFEGYAFRNDTEGAGLKGSFNVAC
jgi:hypothetical protein